MDKVFVLRIEDNTNGCLKINIMLFKSFESAYIKMCEIANTLANTIIKEHGEEYFKKTYTKVATQNTYEIYDYTYDGLYLEIREQHIED